MHRFRWFNGQDRWQRDIDAYVDGELAADDLARFESHIMDCAACTALVGEASALKRMVSSELAQHPAPRSFRLTPAMLAESKPVDAPAQMPWWPKAAQAVGGVALAAFAVLVVVDLSGPTSSGDFDTTRASSDGAAESESMELDTAEAPAASPQPGGGSADDVSEDAPPREGAAAPVAGNEKDPEGDDDDTSMQSAADESERPTDAGAVAADETSSQDLEDANGDGGMADEEPAADQDEAAFADEGRSMGEAGGGSPASGLEQAVRSDDSGFDGLLAAQVIAGIVAAGAGVTYIASRRRNQE